MLFECCLDLALVGAPGCRFPARLRRLPPRAAACSRARRRPLPELHEVLRTPFAVVKRRGKKTHHAQRSLAAHWDRVCWLRNVCVKTKTKGGAKLVWRWSRRSCGRVPRLVVVVFFSPALHWYMYSRQAWMLETTRTSWHSAC